MAGTFVIYGARPAGTPRYAPVPPVEPVAGGRPELLPQLRLDELLAELQARLQAVLATRDRMRGLLEAVVAISSGLDLESTLRRITQTAIELVDATYGALGVVGSDGKLAEFIPVGLSDEEIGRIDHRPGVPDDGHAPPRVRGDVHAVGLEGHDRAPGRGGELATGIRPDDDVPVVQREVHEFHRGQRLPRVDDPAQGHLPHQPQALTPRQLLDRRAVEVHTLQDARNRCRGPRAQSP
jgi:hypothetical protein